jgi:hypothetical protein
MNIFYWILIRSKWLDFLSIRLYICTTYVRVRNCLDIFQDINLGKTIVLRKYCILQSFFTSNYADFLQLFLASFIDSDKFPLVYLNSLTIRKP